MALLHSMAGRSTSSASTSFSGRTELPSTAFSVRRRASRSFKAVQAVKDGAMLEAGRKLRVAVVGGGPSGACAAETLCNGGVEAFLFERKLDNCKVQTQIVCTDSFPCRPSIVTTIHPIFRWRCLGPMLS